MLWIILVFPHKPAASPASWCFQLKATSAAEIQLRFSVSRLSLCGHEIYPLCEPEEEVVSIKRFFLRIKRCYVSAECLLVQLRHWWRLCIVTWICCNCLFWFALCTILPVLNRYATWQWLLRINCAVLPFAPGCRSHCDVTPMVTWSVSIIDQIPDKACWVDRVWTVVNTVAVFVSVLLLVLRCTLKSLLVFDWCVTSHWQPLQQGCAIGGEISDSNADFPKFSTPDSAFLLNTGVWRERLWVPLDFENFSKKGCFHSFEWERDKFHHFSPLL